MRRSFLKSAVVLVALSMLCGMGQPAFAGPSKALFMYWRGETGCGKGLKAGLEKAGVKLEITEFDAARDKAKLDAFIADLDESQYDFIYTFGTTITTKTAAKVKKTPILFGIVASPLKAGVIDSWESSGRNVTGISHAFPYPDQVDFMLQLGAFDKVGMIYNPAEKNSKIAHAELTKILATKGIGFVAAPASAEAEIEGALANLVAEKVGLVYLPSDSFIISEVSKIAPVLKGNKIMSYGAVAKLIDNGAMIGIGADYYIVGQELAKMAEQLVAGTPAAKIAPVRLPLAKQTIMVNAQTAEAVGAEIPYEILRVAKIIE